MTLYEYYTPEATGFIFVGGTKWIGQTFTVGTVGPNEDHEIAKVRLKLERVGSPGELVVGIRNTDGSGKPTGSDLTSGSIDADSVISSTSYEWYDISLTPYLLTASTKYAIVIRAPSGDQNNGVFTRAETSSPTYAGGVYVQSSDSGASWSSNSNIDLLFEEHSASLAVAYMKPIKIW